MSLLERLISTLPDGKVTDLRVGLHWTAVVVESQGESRCGLAATMYSGHAHRREPDYPLAGALIGMSAHELAMYVLDDRALLAGLGMAAINSLIIPPAAEIDFNAEEIIARLGEEKQVALVGHFPFVPKLRERVGNLIVLEQNPQPGDLPAEAAGEVIPSAEVVAITAMTLINHTLDALLDLCAPQATVILLGPSTPLSPVLFTERIDILSGAVVTDIPAVLVTVSQGGNFHQVHGAGVKLASITRPGLGGFA